MSNVMRHAARRPLAWLIFDVGQKMKLTRRDALLAIGAVFILGVGFLVREAALNEAESIRRTERRVSEIRARQVREEGWKVIQEGFRFTVPNGWQELNVRGFDSHVGKFAGKKALLEFDHVRGLGYTNEKATRRIDELKLKEANPKLLDPDEEIWRIDGRIGRYSAKKADPKIYGHREYENVASLFVPFEGMAAYLHVLVFYESESELPAVRRILKSFRW